MKNINFQRQGKVYIISFASKVSSDYSFYSIDQKTYDFIKSKKFIDDYDDEIDYYMDANMHLFTKLSAKINDTRVEIENVYGHAILILLKTDSEKKFTLLICDSATELKINGVNQEVLLRLTKINFKFDNSSMAISSSKKAIFGDDLWSKTYFKELAGEEFFKYELYYLPKMKCQNLKNVMSKKEYDNVFKKESMIKFKFDFDDEGNFLNKIKFRTSVAFHLEHYLVLIGYFNKNPDMCYLCSRLEIKTQDNYINPNDFIKFDGLKLFYSINFINKWPKTENNEPFKLGIMFIDRDAKNFSTENIDQIPMPGDMDYDDRDKYQGIYYEKFDYSHFERRAKKYSKKVYYTTFHYEKYEYMKIHFIHPSLEIYSPAIRIDLVDIYRKYNFYNIENRNNFEFDPLLPFITSAKSISPSKYLYIDKNRNVLSNDNAYPGRDDDLKMVVFGQREDKFNYYVPYVNQIKFDVQKNKIFNEKNINRLICPCCGQSIIPYFDKQKKIKANPFRFNKEEIVTDLNVLSKETKLLCSNSYCNEKFKYDDNLFNGSLRFAVKLLNPGVDKTGLEFFIKQLDEKHVINPKVATSSNYGNGYHIWQSYKLTNATNPEIFYVNYFENIDLELNDKDIQSIRFCNSFITFIFAETFDEFINYATSLMSAINDKFEKNPKFYTFLKDVNIIFCYAFDEKKGILDGKTKNIIELDDEFGINYDNDELNTLLLDNIDMDELRYSLAMKKLSLRNDLMTKYINTGKVAYQFKQLNNFNKFADFQEYQSEDYHNFKEKAYSYLKYTFAYGSYMKNDEDQIVPKDLSYIFNALFHMRKM